MNKHELCFTETSRHKNTNKKQIQTRYTKHPKSLTWHNALGLKALKQRQLNSHCKEQR